MRHRDRIRKNPPPPSLTTTVVKAEDGRVRRKSLDINRRVKQEIVNQVTDGASIRSVLKSQNLSYPRYYQWMNKDIEFKRKMTLAKEGRSLALHEQFYENNVQPIAETNYQSMDEYDLDLQNKRTSVIAKSQSILTAFKREDAPQLYNKDLNQLNVETMNNMNFNINLDQLKKVVGAFKPQVIEGEIVASEHRNED